METTTVAAVGASIPLAAFNLALRITGSEHEALDAVRVAAASEPDDLVRAVRIEARARRREHRPEAVEPPGALAAVPAGDWELVERVALRGETLAEAAADLGLSTRVAALRLHAGLRLVDDLLGERKANGQHRAAAVGGGRLDRPAHPLRDAARDRQPKAAAHACIAL